MIIGILGYTKTFLKNMIIASYPLMAFLQGMALLLNLLIIKNRQSCPVLVLGKPLMKSMEILSCGLVGKGNGFYKYFLLC